MTATDVHGTRRAHFLPLSWNQMVLSVLSLAGWLEMTAGQLSQGQNTAVGSRPPTQMHRARISVNGYKIVMGVQFTDQPQVFDAYNFRVRWLEPTDWNDDGEESKRYYDLICWIQRGEQLRTLVSRKMSYQFSGYNEKYQFPAGYDGTMQCKARPVNSAELPGEWTFTPPLQIAQIPIYLPGIESVDVRNFSNEEIVAILKKAQAESDKEEAAAAAASGSAGSNLSAKTEPGAPGSSGGSEVSVHIN